MIDNPHCPVCDHHAWRPIGRRTFRRAQADRVTGWHRRAFDILFQVWAPDAEEFSVVYQLCEECGFVLYTPRPSSADVDAKYAFSKGLPRAKAYVPYDTPWETLRTRRIFDILAPHLDDVRGARILDYGGSDGRLVRSLAEAGAACEVADYSGSAVPGVKQVGATLTDLDAQARYDAILCSHVAEHVTEPVRLVQDLAALLKPGGTMYVEVPVEIWRRPPAPSEPVTHINFFTPASLHRLMARTGLAVEYCRLGAHPHPQGGWRMVAGCIAHNRGAATQPAVGDGVREVESLLKPGLGLRLRHRALLARDIPAAILRKARRFAGGGAGARDLSGYDAH